MLQGAARGEPLATVAFRVSITVSRDIAAGAVTEFLLFPPKGFQIDASNAKLGGLPVLQPMEWDTNIGALRVNIQSNKPLYRGTYSLRANVQHPPADAFITGFDNTWQIKA